MSAKIKKGRSVSVEDLGNIVKKMIEEVLEDTEQAAKLHQAVFEEYFSKKMEEFREVKAKIDADRELEKKTEEPEPEVHIERSNDEIGDTEPKNIDAIPPEVCPHSSESSKNDDDADVSVAHVVRRAKYVKLSENIRGSEIILGSGTRQTTTDLTQNPQKIVTPSAKIEERIEPEDNSPGDAEVIEWWKNSSMNKVSSEDKIGSQKAREIPVDFKSRGEIAFENWKKAKTDAYHRVFREEQERRRQDQAARAVQNEKKKAANEAYLSWKRQRDARQRSNCDRRPMIPQVQESQSEKRRANSQAFRAWKRQKDAISRDRRVGRSQTAKPQAPPAGVHVTFDAWCNQLDSVLHQKYLRERRYLVHSFYCQPTYFGSAALCGG